MNFKEALCYLNLQDYGERIFNSNTKGELFYIEDYIKLAKYCKENEKYFDVKEIRDIFISYLKIDKTDTLMQYFPVMIKFEVLMPSVEFCKKIDELTKCLFADT